MPRFGSKSRMKLDTCDERLQRVFEKVIEEIDCTILEGERGEERQNFLFDSGQSKVRYPNGKHNSSPSRAVDVAPWPIDWENRERFILFAGYVLGVANEMDIPLRWGGDWNTNWDTQDHTFFDGPHFELVD
jgi:peptidoglycan L-alanyl-D-glutamate endopeptidase CwlK